MASASTNRTETAPDASPAPGSAPPFQRMDTIARYPYPLRDYARRFAWEWVQRLLMSPAPRRATRWRCFWLRLFGATLGPGCVIRPGVDIKHPWLLTVGAHSTIADRVRVYNLGPITIGDHTVVSQDAHLCAGSHDYTKPDLPLTRPPIRIGNGVWVCAEAFIGPGVSIGDNSVVGARAVVSRDVEPGVVVAGNPARTVRKRPMAPAPTDPPAAPA